MELLVRSVTAPAGEVVFPPPPGARAPRGSLASVLGDVLADPQRKQPPGVSEPSLDTHGAFAIVGRSFQISFDQSMELPPLAAAAPASQERRAAPSTLRLTPEVPGVARWINHYTLEFTAAAQFEAGRTYEVALGALKSASGEALPAWSAKLTATPSVTIAGKVLGYVPTPAVHRIIAVHPSDESTLARTPTLSVLYDQPISLTVARGQVSLTDADDRSIPLVLDHPRSGTFQGISVDPRLVVLVRPATPLVPGQDVVFRASGAASGAGGAPGRGAVAYEDSEVVSRRLHVARSLALEEVKCAPYYDDDVKCAEENGQIWFADRGLYLRFNHGIDMASSALAHHVSVTPPVRNLAVRNEPWDNRVSISGGFESSKSYQVNVSGLLDEYGGRLAEPLRLTVRKRPQEASVTMPEGLLVLDPATSKSFPLTSRNVEEAEFLAWAVPPGDAAAFDTALSRARTHAIPAEAPSIRVPVPVKALRSDALVTTGVDLGKLLPGGGSYLATVRPVKLVSGARAVAFPQDSEASRPSVALVRPARETSLAAHVRTLAGATVVHVTRLARGEPVAGASVTFEGHDAQPAKTDPQGVALLGASPGGKLRVEMAGETLFLPLDEGGIDAKQLFPELAGGVRSAGDEEDESEEPADVAPSVERAMIFTDRGIYRPGSAAFIKAAVRRPEGDRLVPVAGAPVEVRVVGPTGEEVRREAHTTGDLGSVAARFDIPADGKVGRHQVLLTSQDKVIASTIVQVAEFEPPRFAVDVDATETPGGMRAKVRGRYLFGAAMDGGDVSWTLRREPASFPDGPLTQAGLSFRRPRAWWEDRDAGAAGALWSRAGNGTLGPDGTLAVEQALAMDGTVGPQAFVLEADVTDSSNRHIAGRARMVKHPVSRYAGLRVPTSWVGVGASVPVELGAIDTQGQPVIGAKVTARLTRLSWSYSQQRGPGGALRWTWSPRRTDVGRCEVKSAATAVRCDLDVQGYGDHEITAEIDGRPGGTASLWAWRHGSSEQVSFPDRGRAVQLTADKPRYAAGDTAKILVRSPYKAATALLTVEQGRLLEHRSVRVEGSSAVFEVPITAAHAPHVHVAVTLLPIGESGATALDYKVGAVRVPVSLAGARLDLTARADRRTYEPGEEVAIDLSLKDGQAPVEGAEIALAVVDEGILRLTDFHQPDPVVTLRPGQPLRFRLRDSREGLAELLERSHIAGDGSGSERATIDQARKDFVETALWRPDLRTDAAGKASVRFKLPDNLTQFRIMALALDRAGKGAVAESDFTVRKPLMIVPVLPRFATRGDRFELAAMVHNNTDAPVAGTVRLGDRTTAVAVPAGGHSKVAFPFQATQAGEQALSFAIADGSGKVRDAVDLKLRVDEPGLEERPHLEGAFVATQAVSLAVPASVDTRGGSLRLRVGQNLWPELGARLEFLLGYPHGCVEQTTSSTLPLIAARTILPRIGISRLSDQDIAVRIRAGLDRLATMRTASGGLGYWPGDDEPNVYGTAYAMRAVVLAKASGVTPPPGLLDGMKRYLTDRLLDGSVGPEVRAAIAQSLAELHELPPSAADALYDTRDKQSVFGKASLALALASLPGQDDRVATLVDAVLAGFDAEGKLTSPPKSDDFYYYGSPTRSRAQAAMALTRLRRSAPVLPGLLSSLVRETEAYTTQATSYALLAVASQLAAAAGEGTPVRAFVDGEPLAVSRDLGFGSKELTIPLDKLRGKRATLRLEADGQGAVAYQLEAAWRRAFDSEEAGQLAATRAQRGPSVHRIYTDPSGRPLDLAAVRPGDVVRVALLIGLPTGVPRERLGYLAITDRLPGGFEPIQPDLNTVASAPDLDGNHPLAGVLRYGSDASHVELRDDRVHLYFNEVSGERVAATYLARATTAGEFVVPPASAELMYEGDSTGYSEAERVVIR
ncbi:Hypothetical protein CAP_1225 [Chondromyces apiculatus DSM 436]|uniref:Alpha-2-macroglobulin n=1 Tax=Chondromyces apiculatus DSM 436 TaxID=1192034 RepID=A0A017TED5_9BACT|nr:Hypothetical protein CAP_1225 [Chondromyces apiculatus DSM 436]